MKKKVLATVLVILTLTGCGSTAPKNAAAEAPKEETVAKTESVVKEEPKAPEKVEKTETTAKKAETKVEKTETKAEEPKPEEKAEETAATAEVSTEVQEKETEATAEAAPAEPVATETVEQQEVVEPTYATVIEKYIADGDFTDYQAYGIEMGADDAKIASSEKNIDFLFNGYVVAIRTNVSNSDEYTYVAIGTAGGTTMTYACDILFTGKPAVPVSASGASVSIESLMILEQTINYMKDHPDPNQIPNIPGTTWVVW